MLEPIKTPETFASTIHLTLTRQCNMSCSYCTCDTGMPQNVENMSTKEWIEVVDQVTDAYGPAVIIVKGGEPMLRPDFFEILSHIKAKGHFIFLITNGLLIQTAATAMQLAQYVDQMEISLDGISPETTDPIKGQGMFDRIMTAVGLVRQAGIKLGLSFVVLEDNRSILWEGLESFLNAQGGNTPAVRIDDRINFPAGQQNGQGDFFDFLRQSEKLACHGRLGHNPASFELEIDARGYLHPGFPAQSSGPEPAQAC